MKRKNRLDILARHPLEGKGGLCYPKLKKGMKYVGTVIIYSYLQAIGVINDHETDCCCYNNF